MFGCKACKAKDSELEHLRKWIDRMMEKKAPEIKEDVVPDPRLNPDPEDTIYQTQEP